MQPAEFIEALSRHYSKRHESIERQSVWLREMVESVRGFDPRVLAKAYEMIRDEYDERAFPLPATIKKFTVRAAEQIYPESRLPEERQFPWSGKSYRAPDSADHSETCRRAREWQHRIIREYGTWANYHRSVKHTYQDVVPAKRDVSKSTFETLMARSRNRHLYADHQAIAKRITGERE